MAVSTPSPKIPHQLELVIDFEEEFGITITDEEAQATVTVG